MKQVAPTEKIRAKFAKAAGPDADFSKVVVFEATALNTNPVRKNHPLYKDARHSRRFLEQMHQKLQTESLPLQIMHDTNPLPVGRVFDSEVLSNATGSELRVLFWVEAAHADAVGKLNSGTVDQVSVQVLGKAAKCSVCGFDFFGESATYEQIWSGTCENGHTMGVDGAHAVLDELDSWYELSLVGQGGIAGARVHSTPERRLAANGAEAGARTLTLSSSDLEHTTMELKDLLAKYTAQTDELATLKASTGSDKAKVTALEAEVDALKAKIQELEARPSQDDAINAAVAAVAEVLQPLLAKTGDVTTQLSGKPLAELKTLAATISAKLAVKVDPAAPQPKVVPAAFSATAFKRAQ